MNKTLYETVLKIIQGIEYVEIMHSKTSKNPVEIMDDWFRTLGEIIVEIQSPYSTETLAVTLNEALGLNPYFKSNILMYRRLHGIPDQEYKYDIIAITTEPVFTQNGKFPEE